MEIICGVDEAGRGPLIGNVVAAAVVLDPVRPIAGLKDSKKLTHSQRELLYQKIISQAMAWGVGHATAAEIDKINILQATMLAMKRAVDHLIQKHQLKPSLVLIDGNKAPNIEIPTKTIIQGDVTQPCISAASILAKVTRDLEMMTLHEQYPEYGFAQHMGYPTLYHLEKLSSLGIIPGYRMSFSPVKKIAQRDGHV
jgi:ribonuclease HII